MKFGQNNRFAPPGQEASARLLCFGIPAPAGRPRGRV